MSGFGVPVAILNFNRPHLTRQVFEVVRQIKPRRLLLIADGPRADRPDDVRLCAEVRAIFEEIDWDCEVSRKFSDINLGSFKSNSSGLNWVFDTVEEAIVIEDDCIPSLSFFRFCEELLERYRDDPKVGVITGYNLGFPEPGNQNDSYFFSAYVLTWAWASWRRVWKQVDLDMSWWTQKKGKELLQGSFPQPAERRYWYALYKRIHSGVMRNAWDYQLMLTSCRHAQHCIIPSVNMVSNIGFGVDGTNCFDESSPLQDVPRGEIGFPLVHPTEIRRSAETDSEIFRIRFQPPHVYWWILKSWLLANSRLIRVLNHVRKKFG